MAPTFCANHPPCVNTDAAAPTVDGRPCAAGGTPSRPFLKRLRTCASRRVLRSGMKRRMLVGCIVIGAIVGMALTSASRGVTGGSFERVVGVGARGASAVIKLNQTGSRSDSNLGGAAVAVPAGGYVRVYPFIGGLPAIPGRFYPVEHVL